MTEARADRLATAIVLGTGLLWGLYWLPVRALSGAGLPGAWGTVAITLAAAVLLSPVAILRRRRLIRADRVGLLSYALGGAAFALYSVAFVYGIVAIVILLFYLTPVWSVLIGRYAMGWPVSWLRVAAIAVGLAGLAVMLGADGTSPLPRGAGEWMGLAAGVLWSVGSTGIRVRSNLKPPEAALVFALGAAVASLAIAPPLAPWPGGVTAGAAALAVVSGACWWVLSVAALMWATARLDPARVGILLMAEVLVGAVSAAMLAGERLGPVELAGGALVLCAAVLEVWPARRRRPVRSGRW